jgi:spermidine/putrescine transport system permease protein
MLFRLHDRPWSQRAALIGPALVFIGFFMLVPLSLMAIASFQERNIHGGLRWGTFSTEAYIRFLFERRLDDSLLLNLDYLKIFARSFWLSFTTTVFAILVGFPTALYMAMRPARYKTLLIFFVTIPFWTNLLVRNYSWILLLRDRGLINNWLMDLGVISQPLPLLYNDLAVAIGLTYSFLPFMVLPIYASLEKMDFRLVEAAYDLYADRLVALRRVIIPLTMPGIVAGSILVFVPCLGSYITPELLGGGRSLMIGNLIQLQFGDARNWPFGAALAFALLRIVLLSMVLYALRASRTPVEGR